MSEGGAVGDRIIDFRILTNVSIITAGGSTVRVGVGHESTLLALFVTNPGYAFAIDSIVTAIWGDYPPAAASRSLHVYISKLRRLLATHGPGSATISGGSGWYQFDVDTRHTDIGRFRRLTTAARDARCGNRKELFRLALSEITGDVLAGLPATPFTSSFRDTFGEIALDAEIEMHAAGGGSAPSIDGIARLRALVADHPYDERLWAMLIEALHQSGRRAEAVLAGRTVTALLAEHLGLDPNAELTELLRSIETGSQQVRAPIAIAT